MTLMHIRTARLAERWHAPSCIDEPCHRATARNIAARLLVTVLLQMSLIAMCPRSSAVWSSSWFIEAYTLFTHYSLTTRSLLAHYIASVADRHCTHCWLTNQSQLVQYQLSIRSLTALYCLAARIVLTAPPLTPVQRKLNSERIVNSE